jgi:hypothetical protein
LPGEGAKARPAVTRHVTGPIGELASVASACVLECQHLPFRSFYCSLPCKHFFAGRPPAFSTFSNSSTIRVANRNGGTRLAARLACSLFPVG